MPFDREIVEARLALNLIPSSDMPRLAWDALEAGFDGPAIRRLAALMAPDWSEVAYLRSDVMREMRLATVTAGEAARRLAKHRAKEILGSGADPLGFTKYFYQLWAHAGYPREIASVGCLDDDVHGRMLGSTREEAREYVTRELNALVNS